MILHDIVGREAHPAYQSLAIDNLNRQYDFLRSAVVASLAVGRPMLSIEVIKSLNHHAIACLHAYAGEYRPCAVQVGSYVPPEHYRVPSLMHHFIDGVNRSWEGADPVYLGAYVLWQMNYIHPFINGNGRTARALCHFAICLKVGGWLPGAPIVAQLLVLNRDEYVAALRHADATHAAGAADLVPLGTLLARLLDEQLNGPPPPPPPLALPAA